MSALRNALGDLAEDVFFDLLESEEAYLLVLDIPGVTADSLELSIDEGMLSIEAHREKNLDTDYRYLEENRSLFLDLELPVPEDATGVDTTATVERGVLELTLPKTSAGGETTIDVIDEDAS